MDNCNVYVRVAAERLSGIMLARRPVRIVPLVSVALVHGILIPSMI